LEDSRTLHDPLRNLGEPTAGDPRIAEDARILEIDGFQNGKVDARCILVLLVRPAN
jgi:hypothetical protein